MIQFFKKDKNKQTEISFQPHPRVSSSDAILGAGDRREYQKHASKRLGMIIPILQQIAIKDFSQNIEIPKKKDEFTEVLAALKLMAGSLKETYDESEKMKIAARNVLEDFQTEKEKLAEAKVKDEALLESIGEGVVAVDSGGKIILINRAAEQMFGQSANQVIGKLLFETWPMLDKNGNLIFKEKHPISIALSGKTAIVNDLSFSYKTEDRAVFPVSITATPVVINSKIIGAIVVFRDVTREKEIDRIKSEFISIASHQLRTPLTGIKWFSELLIRQKTEKLSANQIYVIQQIHESNERMIQLVNDLLDVSHIETGQKFVIEKTQGDIIVLISKAIKDQKINWSDKKIAIKLDESCPNKLILSFDQGKIYQVFSNLISNSVKYSSMGKGKKVIIGLKQLGDQTRFFVKDFGLGIPENQKNRVFQKFFRADNTAHLSAEGTGLGLYIAKGIVDAHGGKIWFESAENKGTVFYFTL